MQGSETARHAGCCLVVDDDDEIRSSVADFLTRFGFRVTVAADGRTMRRVLSSETPDIVVLDVMLPDESGLELCRWARQVRPEIAIIMLTAQGDPGSRVVGLELGADDYVAKPFEPRELVARLHAVLRRTRDDARPTRTGLGDVVRFSGWEFDRIRRQLVSPLSVVVALSGAEFRLLGAFVERAGRLLTREQLLDMTRAPGTEVNDRSIDLAVSRLRQKFSVGGEAAQLIRTVRGEGYLFDGSIEP